MTTNNLTELTEFHNQQRLDTRIQHVLILSLAYCFNFLFLRSLYIFYSRTQTEQLTALKKLEHHDIKENARIILTFPSTSQRAPSNSSLYGNESERSSSPESNKINIK